MLLFKTLNDLQKHITLLKQKGSTIGFVPTMGALHQGHLSLIQKAKAYKDVVVCSIFVNPTQFDDAKDLEKYPRTLGRDIELLEQINTDILFAPSVHEVYPKGLDTSLSLDFGQLDKVLEGAFRLGHFDGMAQVVKRLLDMVTPDRLYMGQKDYQQFTIVRSMLEQINLDIELIVCPIKREQDGLAMSSRNTRLNVKEREQATLLSELLFYTKDNIKNQSIRALKKYALKRLSQEPNFKVDYFEIVDGKTLQEIDSIENVDSAIACTAVFVGEIRLIDNIILK